MPKIDERSLETTVLDILNRRPAVGLALSVVRRGSPPWFFSHGMADVSAASPVTEDTVFRIGSITKTFTAVAVMQLWERGLLDLDTPANDYLRAFQLIPAKSHWGPATVRHLLTHTAGIPELVHPLRAVRSGWFGETVPLGEPVPTLAEFYRGRLQLVAEPGATFTYTNHTFATLGQLVEDVSGRPLDRVLRERVFEPVGMGDTDLLLSERLRARLATGYKLSATGPRPVTERQGVTPAAGEMYSTPRDMRRYLAALLAGGEGEHGAILKPDTLAMMFAPHYQPEPRLPGFGLGFYRADLRGHRAVEHPGIIEGFNSQLFVAPDDGVGVVALTNGARNAVVWLTAETAKLLGDLIGAPEDRVRTDVPHQPHVWREICGWYAPVGQRTDMQARGMAGAGVHVAFRRGRLTLRALSPLPALHRGLDLHPDDPYDPYAFRVDLSAYDLGTAKVVFGPASGRMRLYADVAPVVLQKRSPQWRWRT